MKYFNNIKKVFFIIVIATAISCSEEFLEVEPKGVTILQTTKDYASSLNSNDYLGQYFWTYETMVAKSVEACAIDPDFTNSVPEVNPKRAHFEWTPDVFTPADEADGSRHLIVDGYLREIYLYNKIANEVMESTGGSEAEKQSIRAEALAGRARNYFRLINFFAQPYNAATASSDLGFPIITEADVNIAGVTRASTQEVYDLIIEDLTAAMPYLDTDVSQRPRMSKGAAQGLLGEVYLNMNRYDDALQEINNAMATLASNAGLPIGLYDYNITTLPGGTHAAGFIGPRELLWGDNIETVTGRLDTNFFGSFQTDHILLKPETSALYGPSDLRLSHWFKRAPFRSPFDYPVPGTYSLFGKSRISGFLGVNMPNLYLMRAECKARTNDLSGAITDLEFLRMHRMDPADASVPTGLSQEDLIKFVIDERTREFALSGATWLDTRRLWNDPLFQDKKPYTHVLYNADGSVQTTFTLTEERLVSLFPQSMIIANPDLVNNP